MGNSEEIDRLKVCQELNNLIMATDYKDFGETEL